MGAGGTVIAAGVLFLLEAVAPCIWAVGSGGPTAGGLVGSLAQESGHLPLAGGSITGGGEGREGLGGLNEGIVCVEAFGGAASIVAVLQHLVEGIPGDDVGEASTGGTGGPTTLALAASATVLTGGATPTELAAA